MPADVTAPLGSLTTNVLMPSPVIGNVLLAGSGTKPPPSIEYFRLVSSDLTVTVTGPAYQPDRSRFVRPTVVVRLGSAVPEQGVVKPAALLLMTRTLPAVS